MSDVQIANLNPGALNIEAYQGDDFARDVQVTDGTTGYALSDAKMQIKTMAGTAVVTLVVGSGITITNPGTVTIVIAKAAMAALTPTSYRYDLQVTFTSNSRQRTVLSGLFTISAETTI